VRQVHPSLPLATALLAWHNCLHPCLLIRPPFLIPEASAKLTLVSVHVFPPTNRNTDTLTMWPGLIRAERGLWQKVPPRSGSACPRLEVRRTGRAVGTTVVLPYALRTDMFRGAPPPACCALPLKFFVACRQRSLRRVHGKASPV